MPAANVARAADLLAPWSGCGYLPPDTTPAPALDTERDPSDDPARPEAYPSDEFEPSGSNGEQSDAYKATYPFLSASDKPGFLGRISSFRVSEMIGEGGMGYVFLAEDKYLRRPVALKVMKPEVAKRKRCWGWFLDEARAAASLQSDRLAAIYQIGEQKGTLYLAMELLHGESLHSRLKRGPISLSMALWVLREAALGLAQVHRVGVFHRDIKPGNLWLGVARDPDRRSADVVKNYGHEKEWRVFQDDEYCQIKILDFGLARLTEGGAGRAKRGEAVGTPPYMSPEQANGQPGDARSDIFSLGVVMYRLLANELPFNGSTLMEMITSMATPPRPLASRNPELPPELTDLSNRMLALEPMKRPQTAAEVAEIILGVESRLAAVRAEREDKKGSVWRRMFGSPRVV